jgi:hypothetical protein
MPGRFWPNLIVVAGILAVVVSLFADPLGIGRSPGFGWRQMLGVVTGLLLTWRGLQWRGRGGR